MRTFEETCKDRWDEFSRVKLGFGIDEEYERETFSVSAEEREAIFEAAWQGTKDVDLRDNAVCPSMVETPMAHRIFRTAGRKETYEAMVPSGRLARPEEVAAAVAHLSSDEAGYVNGASYSIDGGSGVGYYKGPAADQIQSDGTV
ncbi:SDR family oxidoreductase [Nocardia jiangxiensis]|uniref:SDR family oxidoreductase n=1 Tax=Nocardia jiangxiensis TaxID=282685 RepID=A0ABW6SAU3_9NOCA|nr:SDR family oxidoreductase [Nocardia jiangxiensis]